MSYLALYRKYRPNSFEEVVGQDKVITVIKNAVINDKVSHAYLFSGPRGTGKTTTAKILAKMVNCENLKDGIPCGKCNSCLNVANSSDVVEIDAASNNGVDEIRELRDKVNLVPSELKYKIYIIDEVHMLTTQAFNALLKTLEEPPKHVIFVLATTEFHKIPMTIISRCQRFQFSKIDAESMVNNLRRISKAEGLTVDDSVFYEISRISDGCCRDAVNLFDQLISYSNGSPNLEQLYDISGSVPHQEISRLINFVLDNEFSEVLKFCNKINEEGKNIFKFVEEFMLFLKDIIAYDFGYDDINIFEKREEISKISERVSVSVLYDWINYLNDLLNKLKYSSYPFILLSACLFEFMNKHFKSVELDNSFNNDLNLKNMNNTADTFRDNDESIVNSSEKLSADEIDIRVNNALALASKDLLITVKDKLNNLDNLLLNSEYDYLYGILKDCFPIVAGEGYIIMSAKYDSLVERFNLSYVDIELFFETVFNHKIYVAAITNDVWNEYKSKYIDNLKKRKKYEIKPILKEKKFNNLSDETEVKKNEQTDLELLKDLVGNDIINYVD